jgi:hypothetical protein
MGLTEKKMREERREKLRERICSWKVEQSWKEQRERVQLTF